MQDRRREARIMLTESSFLNDSSGDLYGGATPAASAAGRSALTRSIQRMGTTMSFARGVEIYGEKEPPDYFYNVISGCVRAYTVLIDGRRQVTAFYLPGDVFGLETGEEYIFSAEAVAPSRIRVVKRSAVVSLAARDSDVACELWMLTGRELQRARHHALLLCKTAPERVASFLLEMDERTQGDEVELPMSRQDIADHLGLTIETVSRILTQFARTSAIALPTCRRFALSNRAVLQQLVA
jgi:CRP/FNR family nitrogen fixation transcriptional regulator